MEKKIFTKACCTLFKELGFQKKGSSHFYKNISDDIMLVVGLCLSNYDTKYWFDGGFVVKPINKHMPYPKYYDANIRIMDIGIEQQYYFDYLNIDQNSFEFLEDSIRKTLTYYSHCNSREIILEKIIVPGEYELCKDYDIQQYFNFTFPPRRIIPDESQIN